MTGAALDLDFSAARAALAEVRWRVPAGRVLDVTGLVVEATGPAAPIGATCRVAAPRGELLAEVVGFRDGRTLLMPLGDLAGVQPGTPVALARVTPTVAVGPGLLGRVIDGLGRPLDGRGPVPTAGRMPLYGAPVNPLDRLPITEPLDVGVRAVNALLPCGRGQRVGIVAGSGVGKSALLGMMARHARAAVNVIALVGERGREVRRFLEHDLGAEGLARSVVVAVTADAPALVRIRGALLATAIAEDLRDRCGDVLLLMDSLTRVAAAQREVGLSVGEPPSARGYPPSVFAMLPKLLERAGRSRRGSITGFYTVLVEGDDPAEPIADAARALLDGQLVLSRSLADAGHYPAIDVLASLSRVAADVTSAAEQARARDVRSWLAAYRDAEDLIHVGAYQPGTSRATDDAIVRRPAVLAFLRQALDEPASLAQARAALAALTEER
jgi:flagellum-specific ATP synthase